MNVFMGYNPLVAKQVKVSVWVKEIDGAEPILPATPKDGDCFIVFDTDDDVLADNPSLKKSYANGSWGDAGGGGGSGTVVPVIAFTTPDEELSGTYTSTVPYHEMVDLILNSPWGNEYKTYPIGMHTTSSENVNFNTAEYGNDTLVVYTATAQFTFNEDGTYKAVRT